MLIDTVAKLPRLPHETRGRSDGHVDGVAVAWRRVDAIDANLKFGNVRKRTLSQHHFLASSRKAIGKKYFMASGVS